MSFSIKEFLVVLNLAREKVDFYFFLTDRGTIYSVFISHVGPLSSKCYTVTTVNGKPLAHYFAGPLICQYDQQLISHTFPAVPQCPMPLLGRDLLSSLRAILQLGDPKQPPILTLTETDQQVEQDSIPSHIPIHSAWGKRIPGRAVTVQPVRITLRPEVVFPNKRQYPIKLDMKKGLQPLVNS